jgi:phosphatidate cytidylyltransferase
MTRLLTALALLALFVLMLLRGPAVGFFLLVAVLGGIAVWEAYGLLERRGSRPFKALGTAAAIATMAAFLVSPDAAHGPIGPALPVVATTIAALVAAMARRAEPGEMLDAAVSTLFPYLFVGLTLAYTVGLRAVDDRAGRDLPLLLLLCLAASDSAALYVGRSVGRRRLAPGLSPKKSWEGAVAGIAASVFAAFVALWTFYTRLTPAHCVALGVLLGVAGIVGDLAESMVKRAAGAKDSSGILPGHGGLLDRADSLLFTAPVLYYYYFLFLESA